MDFTRQRRGDRMEPLAPESHAPECSRMILLIVLLAVVLVAFVYFVGIYNSLVGLRERVKQAWANIDVLLKQRHDELPKLIETCRQYMQYEQQTLEKVMQARSAVSQARDA